MAGCLLYPKKVKEFAQDDDQGGKEQSAPTPVVCAHRLVLYCLPAMHMHMTQMRKASMLQAAHHHKLKKSYARWVCWCSL